MKRYYRDIKCRYIDVHGEYFAYSSKSDNRLGSYTISRTCLGADGRTLVLYDINVSVDWTYMTATVGSLGMSVLRCLYADGDLSPEGGNTINKFDKFPITCLTIYIVPGWKESLIVGLR